MKRPSTRYVLTLTPVPDALGRTPDQRLRAALKALLRSWSLRCVSCIEETPNPSKEDSQ